MNKLGQKRFGGLPSGQFILHNKDGVEIAYELEPGDGSEKKIYSAKRDLVIVIEGDI